MTEQEWLECTDPKPMLKFLHSWASKRKLRLVLVACSRLVWDRITDPVMRRGVETAERYADGLSSSEELLIAKDELYRLTYDGPPMFEKARAMGVTFDVFYLSLASPVAVATTRPDWSR
jgi:hypothetical protein